MPNNVEAIDSRQGVNNVLDWVTEDRLAILVGAGLSMAPPSRIQSAPEIAANAKRKYDAMHGATRPPLADTVEAQAEFFFQRGELAPVYFNTLIEPHAFATKPNAGHYAIADLLLIGAIRTAITTNVDNLIEAAGQLIFGEIAAGIDGVRVAACAAHVTPLLKIHGCRVRDPENMIWAPGQLAVEPVASRIRSSATWLNANLLNRNLLIVGYWTDWSYLNAVLAQTLGAVRPSRVLVVNTADTEEFSRKAPELFAIGQRAATSFQHVRTSAADFLAEVRRAFSRSYVRQTLHSGAVDFDALKGRPADAQWLEPPDVDNIALWRIRRDLEGCVPNEPASERAPPAESLVGLTILQLQSCGATSDGQFWLLNGMRIRVIRAANRPKHRVEADFQREMAPVIAPNVVIAVGAESQQLPANYARTEPSATFVRGSATRWLTRTEALEELHL